MSKKPCIICIKNNATVPWNTQNHDVYIMHILRTYLADGTGTVTLSRALLLRTKWGGHSAKWRLRCIRTIHCESVPNIRDLVELSSPAMQVP